MNESGKVVAVLSDLMFIVKIQDAAKRVGLPVVFVKTSEDAIAAARKQPAVILLDLNAPNLDVLSLISALKAEVQTSNISLVGYVSHVQADLKHAAQERGCDQVIARSAFSQNLSAILHRYA